MLDEAAEHEQRYEWEVAAQCYQGFLDSGAAAATEASGLALRMAECHEWAAFQADAAEGFQTHIRAALKIYEEIEQMLANDPGSVPRRIAEASRLRLESMQASHVSDVQQRLDEAIGVHREVVAGLEGGGDEAAWLQAGSRHLRLLYERVWLDTEGRTVALLEEALLLAEKLIGTPCPPTGDDGRGEAFAFHLAFALSANVRLERWYAEPSWVTRILDAALAFAPQVRDQRVRALLHARAAVALELIRGDEVGADEQDAVSLDAARRTGDKRLIGWGTHRALYRARWKLVADRDEEQARGRFQAILALFAEGRKTVEHLGTEPSRSTLAQLYGDVVRSHVIYATNFVTDRGLRKQLIESAVALFREGIAVAQPVGGFSAAYLMSAGPEALRRLASLEEDPSQRRALLAEAIAISDTATALHARVVPLLLWNIGGGYVAGASLRYDLAQQTAEPVQHKELLATAAEQFRMGLANMERAKTLGGPAHVLLLADYYLRFVNALGSLFTITSDFKLVEEQLQAFDAAAQAYTTADRPGRVAETLWQRAQVHAQIGQHKEAARDYGRAADAYRSAAKSTPGLKELYDDLARYMLAWSRIEEARAAHADGLYREASEAYEGASSILQGTHRWAPLGPHYTACTILEEGEALSYEEKPELAAQSFAQAAEGFAAAKQGLDSWVTPTSGQEDKAEKARWTTLTAARGRYSRARAELEEAKLLDHKGERGLSARRFAAATAILEGLTEEEEITETKQEMRTLTLLCQAWQLMKEAEAMSKPEKYGEAARLFEQAAEAAPNERLAAMSRGNAAFCHALESGTRLRLTRDTALYRQTKQFLETAADYYAEGGLDRAAHWTRATERMFDGLVYLAQAESELDAQAKSRSYGLAERSFEAAAQLYAEAGYSAKQAEANRHLQHAREERRVFASPVEALDGAAVVQAAHAHVAPALTRDQSLGIERFEHANLQCNLLLAKLEATVGEPFEVELEIVNAGKAPALLVKAESFPPGLRVTVPSAHVLWKEDHLNFRGRRLEPLESEEVKLRITAEAKGEVRLQPRILYLDEEGGYRSLLADPVMLRVTEPARVGEPLTGERVVRVPTGFPVADRLLLGGIPAQTAVVLASPPCEERDALVRGFCGGAPEATVYVGSNVTESQVFRARYPALRMVVCTRQADLLPKATVLQIVSSIENLSDINIALMQALKDIPEATPRVYVQLVSDVLLLHKGLTTRRWLGDLLPRLRARGCTVVAELNPRMHAAEELHALLDLFDGRLEVVEREEAARLRRFLRVATLRGHPYLSEEAPLTPP